MVNPFHLAIQVHDLNQARKFYGSVLGCSAATWIDSAMDTRLVCHLNTAMELQTYSNPVDSQDVPVSYFEVALNMNDWEELTQRVIYIKFTL